MSEATKIINLTERIRTELQHFVPCVRSEIEAKSSIYDHLDEIRTLICELQDHEYAQERAISESRFTIGFKKKTVPKKPGFSKSIVSLPEERLLSVHCTTD